MKEENGVLNNNTPRSILIHQLPILDLNGNHCGDAYSGLRDS
jgi:hypothetical protein